MLWIHDLPEIEALDVVIIDREEDPHLSEMADRAEKEAAQKILSPKDLKLFKEFEEATAFLKSKVETIDPSTLALIARIIDITDGNMVFHYFFSQWLNSEEYKPEKAPPDKYLSYTFNQYRAYISNLKKLKQEDEPVIKISNNILNEQIDYAAKIYKPVKENRLPRALREQLLWAEEKRSVF